MVEEQLQQNPLAYDKQGEMHYDIISAFIKSIRGSDPDAALYWMARMIEGGEDPQFIARRVVISASEDVGLANPNALLLANAAFDTVMKIGWLKRVSPLLRLWCIWPRVRRATVLIWALMMRWLLYGKRVICLFRCTSAMLLPN